MKYKLKIEFDYTGLETDEIRDYKLDLVEQDIITEIESDYPIPVPHKDEIITLGEQSYSVVKTTHNINKDLYTTTVLVRGKKVAYIVEIEQQKKEKEQYYHTNALFFSKPKSTPDTYTPRVRQTVVVEKISISNGKHQYFIVSGKNFEFSTREITFNINDTIVIEGDKVFPKNKPFNFIEKY